MNRFRNPTLPRAVRETQPHGYKVLRAVREAQPCGYKAPAQIDDRMTRYKGLALGEENGPEAIALIIRQWP